MRPDAPKEPDGPDAQRPRTLASFFGLDALPDGPVVLREPGGARQITLEGTWWKALLFGVFYFLYHKDWVDALVLFSMAFAFVWIAWPLALGAHILFAVTSRHQLARHYVKQGWTLLGGTSAARRAAAGPSAGS